MQTINIKRVSGAVDKVRHVFGVSKDDISKMYASGVEPLTLAHIKKVSGLYPEEDKPRSEHLNTGLND